MYHVISLYSPARSLLLQFALLNISSYILALIYKPIKQQLIKIVFFLFSVVPWQSMLPLGPVLGNVKT